MRHPCRLLAFPTLSESTTFSDTCSHCVKERSRTQAKQHAQLGCTSSASKVPPVVGSSSHASRQQRAPAPQQPTRPAGWHSGSCSHCGSAAPPPRPPAAQVRCCACVHMRRPGGGPQRAAAAHLTIHQASSQQHCHRGRVGRSWGGRAGESARPAAARQLSHAAQHAEQHAECAQHACQRHRTCSTMHCWTRSSGPPLGCCCACASCCEIAS